MDASEPFTAWAWSPQDGEWRGAKGLSHNAPPGVVLRELPWLTYTTSLWSAWHRINLRPLVETFRKVLTEPEG